MGSREREIGFAFICDEAGKIDKILVKELNIEDQGQGISREDMDKLFVPFSKIGTKPTQGESSTGLGLFIVKKIVEEHRGEIVLESEPGKGTRFIIKLPILSTKEEVKRRNTEEKMHQADHQEESKNLDILVAEDNIINQKIIRKLLSKSGHRVTIVDNGLKAIETYDKEKFDIILMDIEMPKMNGLEATRNIRSKEAYKENPIPIIAMTAHDLSQDKERFLNAGMKDYIIKPINYIELLDKLGYS